MPIGTYPDTPTRMVGDPKEGMRANAGDSLKTKVKHENSTQQAEESSRSQRICGGGSGKGAKRQGVSGKGRAPNDDKKADESGGGGNDAGDDPGVGHHQGSKYDPE